MLPFATGGPVPGAGSGDTVPAMLTPGEYVLTKSAVARIGVGQLDQLNRVGFAAGGLVWPVAGPVTQPFGAANGRDAGGHPGIDFGVPTGTAVHVAGAGTVTWAGPQGGYGNLLQVDHGGGVQTLYGHLLRTLVAVGDRVTAGQIGALSDNTGLSTGPHLHFEVRADGQIVDPMRYLSGDMPLGNAQLMAALDGFQLPAIPLFPGGGFGRTQPGAAQRTATAVQSFVDQERALMASAVDSLSGGAAPGAASDWVRSAMHLAGVGDDWFSGLMTLLSRESSFDPRAVNSTPVGNEHATGIAQTLPSTFAAYALAGHGDIFSPVDNIAAAIRYIIDRYGYIGRVQQANPNLPPAGYRLGGYVQPHSFDSGGTLAPGWNYVHNGTGRPEPVAPNSDRRGPAVVIEHVELTDGLDADRFARELSWRVTADRL